MTPDGPTGTVDSVNLRRRAEDRLESLGAPDNISLSPAEALRLLHELQVHEIELELQNEELRSSRLLVEEGLARYADFYDFAPVGYFTLDRSGVIIHTNPAGAGQLGCDRSKAIGQCFASLVATADQPNFLAFIGRIFAGQPDAPHEVELSLSSHLGRTLLMEATLSPDHQECRAVALDITVRRATEARLQMVASVFTHARESIMITDASGIMIEVNDAFTRVTGYSREEALGQNPRMLRSGRQSREFYATMWHHLTTLGHWHGEMWNRRKSGDLYAELITISAVNDTHGQVQSYVAVSTDITPMKEHQRQLEHIAHYDSLTNLPNRVLLGDRLQQAIVHSQRHNQSLAVAYLDLDGFKAINDQHGHAIGDELLVALARRMKETLRDGDTLARIGGDEFVALLSDLEWPNDYDPVLQRLLHSVAEPLMVGALMLQVSASIGVTVYPQDGVDAGMLLRHADQAMYLAKQSGKHCYHLFDFEQDAQVKTQRESLERVRLGLAQGELVLYYQPKVNMKTGVVVGAEALIRWLHPERGLLVPSAFLPVIEGHPLSVEVGYWVIDTALTQMEQWAAAGLDIPVSVNVAALQLQEVDFVTRVGELLAAHPGVVPHCLELEILETSALKDIVQVSEVMLSCARLGVRFALDDFGTGYSSLTYLRRLPAQTLKIDQSFVRDMLVDPDDLAIVTGIVGLATAFRRAVIAEGVETQAHGALLQSVGCELAQGYGIARPMPAQDFPAWSAQWRLAPIWVF